MAILWDGLQNPSIKLTHANSAFDKCTVRSADHFTSCLQVAGGYLLPKVLD